MIADGDNTGPVALLDHFHPPLSVQRHRHAFLNAWATYIASGLNAALPPCYFAEPNVHFGLEIDVATLDEPGGGDGGGGDGGSSGTAAYSPPTPTAVLPFAPTR